MDSVNKSALISVWDSVTSTDISYNMVPNNAHHPGIPIKPTSMSKSIFKYTLQWVCGITKSDIVCVHAWQNKSAWSVISYIAFQRSQWLSYNRLLFHVTCVFLLLLACMFIYYIYKDNGSMSVSSLDEQRRSWQHTEQWLFFPSWIHPNWWAIPQFCHQALSVRKPQYQESLYAQPGEIKCANY